MIPEHELEGLKSATLSRAIGEESRLYAQYVKNPDNASNFKACMDQINPLMYNQGLSVKPLYRYTYSPTQTVVFFFHAPSGMAHVEMAKVFINAPLPFQRVVYYIGRQADEFEQFFNCKVRHIPQNSTTMMSTLQTYLKADRASCLVPVSCPTFAALFAGAELAPNVVWMTFKYSNITIPGVRNIITADGPTESTVTIGDVAYHNCPGTFPKLYDPAKIVEGTKIRLNSGTPDGGVIFGTFARDVKFTSEFSSCIETLLRTTPNAYYVYASDNKPTQFLVGNHDKSRVRYLGWVDTKLWANVIDVYADCFPLPSGLTLCEAAAVGRPVVSIVTGSEPSISLRALRAKKQGLRGIINGLNYQEYTEELVKLAGMTLQERNDYAKPLQEFVLTDLQNESRFIRTVAKTFKRIMK